MTIGSNFFTKVIDLNGEQVRLQLWDLAGQTDFERVRPSFYHGSQAVVYVYDITSQRSINDIQNWHKEVREYLESCPSILIGNKLDLVEKRVINQDEGQGLRDVLELEAFWECSAKTGEGVEECFSDLATILVNRAISMPQPAPKEPKERFKSQDLDFANRTFEI